MWYASERFLATVKHSRYACERQMDLTDASGNLVLRRRVTELKTDNRGEDKNKKTNKKLDDNDGDGNDKLRQESSRCKSPAGTRKRGVRIRSGGKFMRRKISNPTFKSRENRHFGNRSTRNFSNLDDGDT